MAYLVQRLIVLFISGFGAAAAAAEGEFSHALHLKLKPECGSCHAKATTSTKLEDILLPEAQSCQPCHESRTIRKESTLTRLSKFNHELHLKLGNIAPALRDAVKSGAYLSDPGNLLEELSGARNACMACHRGVDQATGKLTKAHFPHMSDCLVCHTDIDPPFSCESCHAKDDATLKPASHTRDFHDTHSRKTVSKASCASCHGRKFTCQGCH